MLLSLIWKNLKRSHFQKRCANRWVLFSCRYQVSMQLGQHKPCRKWQALQPLLANSWGFRKSTWKALYGAPFTASSRDSLRICSMSPRKLRSFKFARQYVCQRVHHYVRYGTYYLNPLAHLEATHPGAKEEIEDVGLSVRHNKRGIGQSIDMVGEQSYMRNAKTAGLCL